MLQGASYNSVPFSSVFLSQLNTECAFRTQDRSGWSLRHPIRMGSPYLIIKGIRLTKAIVTTKGLICYQVLSLIFLKLNVTTDTEITLILA